MSLQIAPEFIDKSLPIPVGQQLYGLLSYLLSHADLEQGTRLPSVRRMATDLRLAQATVAQVYSDLRDAGLLDLRPGSGAYTRLALPQQRQDASALRADIELLLGKAERLGVSAGALASMLTAQAQLRQGRARLNLVFVGVFAEPTADYLADLRPLLAPGDRLSQVLVGDLAGESSEARAARAACVRADAVLTFVHRASEVARLVPEARIQGLRFIPSQATRAALAQIDPRARVAAISQLQEYIAVMKPSVRRFAPHVAQIRVSWAGAPDLGEVLAEAEVVIYATGADHIAERLRPGVPCFEYRHFPDPAALESELVPFLAGLRREAATARPAAPRIADAG